jgi:hypothetical protein
MFVAFMPLCIYFLVLMYCFRFRSVSRKRPFSFESILDSISKSKLHRGLSKKSLLDSISLFFDLKPLV